MIIPKELIGKRVLCYVDYSEETSVHVYPQYIIKEVELLHIAESDRKRMLGPAGCFVLERKFIEGGHAVVEMRSTRRDTDGKNHVVCKFSAYDFENYKLCVYDKNRNSRDVLERGIVNFDANLFPRIHTCIYVRCKDAIIGPFLCEMRNGMVVLKGSPHDDYMLSWYGLHSMALKALYLGRTAGVTLLSTKEITQKTPLRRTDYIQDPELQNLLVDVLAETDEMLSADIQSLVANAESIVLKNRSFEINPLRQKKCLSLLKNVKNHSLLYEALKNFFLTKTSVSLEVFKAIAAQHSDFIESLSLASNDERLHKLERKLDLLRYENNSVRKVLSDFQLIDEKENEQLNIKSFRERLLQIKSIAEGRMTYAESSHRNDSEIVKIKEEYNSVRDVLCRFNLIETSNINYIDVEKLQHKLYKMEVRLEFLKRIIEGTASPNDVPKLREVDIQGNGTDLVKLVADNQQLCKEIEELRKNLNEKDSGTSQKEMELKELETSVCNSINSKIAVLQGKISEFKTVAGSVATQVDQTLFDKIQKLVSSITIGEIVPIANERAENVELSTSDLPLLRFNPKYQSGELGEKIIARVRGYLAVHNRFCSVAEVANYLVCLTQGFMTTFAGNPGSGKTSLCNLLAKSLGLVAEHDGTHFVDVPVSRGWTSAKDFIGYYNPLAKQMVRSNAAVYKALELSEQEDSSEVPPMVILLDEANLSPLEHYWSSFLKNSDFSSSAARTFSLGGDKVWAIGPHLRFLATVNHDHTTEELSPRFLDRSWVILLDGQSSEVDARDINIPDISGEWAAIPYAKLEEAFGVTAHAKLTMKPEVLQLWTAICDVMQKSQMRIMPRNVNMVENYVKTASLYMSDTFAPLDYAMAQKILPTLSGSGERMKTCLTEFQRKCDGKLPRTASLLARMLEAGKHNMEMYQFFVS